MTDAEEAMNGFRRTFAKQRRLILRRYTSDECPDPVDVPDFGGTYKDGFEKDLSDFVEIKLLRELVKRTHSAEWREKLLLYATIGVALISITLSIVAIASR